MSLWKDKVFKLNFCVDGGKISVVQLNENNPVKMLHYPPNPLQNTCHHFDANILRVLNNKVLTLNYVPEISVDVHYFSVSAALCSITIIH